MRLEGQQKTRRCPAERASLRVNDQHCSRGRVDTLEGLTEFQDRKQSNGEEFGSAPVPFVASMGKKNATGHADDAAIVEYGILTAAG